MSTPEIRTISAVQLAPWLWRIHARTLRPFFEKEEVTYVLKDREELSPSQNRLLSELADGELPNDLQLYSHYHDCRWETLPLEATNPEKEIDRLFCIAMAKHILDAIDPQRNGVSAEALAPWLWKVLTRSVPPFAGSDIKYDFKYSKDMTRRQRKLCRAADWDQAKLPPQEFPDLYEVVDHRWESLPEHADPKAEDPIDKAFCRRMAEHVLRHTA